MAQVNIAIAGRNHVLACRDGDEPRLAELAADLTSKAAGLTAALGAMGETRLLVMTALLVADELHELRAGRAPATTFDPVPAPGAGFDPGFDPMLDRAGLRLAELVDRAERLVERLGA